MPAVRVFAPPVDRVGELFAGSGHLNHVADRKVLEQEKKKAYAAELQAQMQQQQAQKQQERQHRYGAATAGAQTSSSRAADAASASAAFSTAAAAAGTAAYAAASSPSYDAQPSPTYATQQQQQPLVSNYQQPNWPPSQGMPGLGLEALQGPGSHSSSSPPPWMQHMLQQTQQQPNYGLGTLQHPQQPMQQQQPYAGWSMPQQQPLTPLGWPGSAMPGMAGPPVGYDNPAYTTTAVPPSFHSMGSMYSPSSSSPVRGFQAGANAAAAVAAMQAAAARSGGLGPPSGSWGFSPTAASANAVDAPFAQQQQWPQVDRGSAAPGRFNPASMGPSAGAAAAGVGASLAGLGGDSSTSSPQRGRGGVQDKARKDAYRAELEAQIRERAERQAVEKAHRAAEEARKEAEMAAYCPWGRGGAGAPLRDASGQVVTGLRGAARQQQNQKQQLHQWQQQHDQQQQQQQQHITASASAGAAWQQQQCMQGHPDMSQLQGESSTSLMATHSSGQQHQQQAQPLQQQYSAGGGSSNGGIGAGGVPGGGGAGPAPVLCFRSDKAFMTSNEIEAKQRQQKELQLELDRQVQEKKRQKELKRQQEEDEARQEEARLAAEQARIAAQFQSEQDAERGRRSSKQQPDNDQQQGSAAGAGVRPGGSELQATKSEGRRRVSVLMAGDDPTPPRQQQQSGQDLAAQPSRTFAGMGAGPGFQQAAALGDPYQQQQQQQAQQQYHPQQVQQQVPFGMQQQQPRMLDAQQRQQMLYEALQLEGHHQVDHAGNRELSRLRHDMEAQSAALRSAVESQGREVAALRATAAAAEAESAAAKAELAQVKRDIKRKSQELPHETLSTMLADYGDGPASSLINAAFHPNPIRRIDLELPPSAAALRRSIELQARTEMAARASGEGRLGALDASGELLGSSGSAVDLLEGLLQHGKAVAPGAKAAGRSASMPAGGAPGWLGSVSLGGGATLRGSMLATESTFIFPAGLQPSAAAAAAAGTAADGAQELGGSSAARQGSGELAGASSAWDCAWQHQAQQGEMPATRHTTSAPGYSSSEAGMPLRPTLSFGRGRDGLVTPGGTDLMAVVNRNADKLRVLQNMPEGGSTEALDQFLSTFAAQSSQPKQPSASGSATPVSRLMTPQVRNRPHRYSNSAADKYLPTNKPSASHAGSIEPGNSFRRLPDIADTLDLELSKLDIQKAAAMSQDAAAAAALAAGPHSKSSYGYGASIQAQQRLMLAGTAAGIGAAAAAAGGAAAGGYTW